MNKRITVADVRTAAGIFFQLSTDEMVSPVRCRRIAYPRMVAMSVSRWMTGASLPGIGRAFGGRDHTTVLAAMRRVEEKPEMQAQALALALIAARVCVDRTSREQASLREAMAAGAIIAAPRIAA